MDFHALEEAEVHLDVLHGAHQEVILVALHQDDHRGEDRVIVKKADCLGVLPEVVEV